MSRTSGGGFPSLPCASRVCFVCGCTVWYVLYVSFVAGRATADGPGALGGADVVGWHFVLLVMVFFTVGWHSVLLGLLSIDAFGIYIIYYNLGRSNLHSDILLSCYYIGRYTI